MLIVCLNHSLDESIAVWDVIAARFKRGLQYFFQIWRLTPTWVGHLQHTFTFYSAGVPYNLECLLFREVCSASRCLVPILPRDNRRNSDSDWHGRGARCFARRSRELTPSSAILYMDTQPIRRGIQLMQPPKTREILIPIHNVSFLYNVLSSCPITKEAGATNRMRGLPSSPLP